MKTGGAKWENQSGAKRKETKGRRPVEQNVMYLREKKDTDISINLI